MTPAEILDRVIYDYANTYDVLAGADARKRCIEHIFIELEIDGYEIVRKDVDE